LAPTAAVAQAGATHFNVALGAAFPVSDYGRFRDMGYNVTVGAGMRQPASALGFRVEGTYNEFGIKNLSSKSHAGGVIGNLTFDLGSATTSGTGNNLYAIGGVGYYGTGSDWNIGYNLGGGFRFPLTGFSAYLEARYHAVSSVEAKFVPVVFGLVF
jgi:hypothetical protein